MTDPSQNRPNSRIPYLRLIDANANRCLEGLRVVEDVCRFEYDDELLTKKCKQLRHELSAAIESIDTLERIHARDTSADVGTTIEAFDEYQRPSRIELIRANSERIKQSLRCLEEASKAFNLALARRFESIRYQFYDLERLVLQSMLAQAKLDQRVLYVLTDGAESKAAFQARLNQIVAGGVHVIQLRDDSLTDRELMERALVLTEIGRRADVLTVINNRPDIAALARASGVHVGQDDLTVAQCRQILPAGALVGVSTHSLPQAIQAAEEGADYIGVGPVFPSATKQFDQTVGLELVREVTGALAIPSFCIGGIDASRLESVIAAGGRRVAVSHAVQAAADPQAAAKQLVDMLMLADERI